MHCTAVAGDHRVVGGKRADQFGQRGGAVGDERRGSRQPPGDGGGLVVVSGMARMVAGSGRPEQHRRRSERIQAAHQLDKALGRPLLRRPARTDLHRDLEFFSG